MSALSSPGEEPRAGLHSAPRPLARPQQGGRVPQDQSSHQEGRRRSVCKNTLIRIGRNVHTTSRVCLHPASSVFMDSQRGKAVNVFVRLDSLGFSRTSVSNVNGLRWWAGDTAVLAWRPDSLISQRVWSRSLSKRLFPGWWTLV